MSCVIFLFSFYTMSFASIWHVIRKSFLLFKCWHSGQGLTSTTLATGVSNISQHFLISCSIDIHYKCSSILLNPSSVLSKLCSSIQQCYELIKPIPFAKFQNAGYSWSPLFQGMSSSTFP